MKAEIVKIYKSLSQETKEMLAIEFVKQQNFTDVKLFIDEFINAKHYIDNLYIDEKTNKQYKDELSDSMLNSLKNQRVN